VSSSSPINPVVDHLADLALWEAELAADCAGVDSVAADPLSVASSLLDRLRQVPDPRRLRGVAASAAGDFDADRVRDPRGRQRLGDGDPAVGGGYPAGRPAASRGPVQPVARPVRGAQRTDLPPGSCRSGRRRRGHGDLHPDRAGVPRRGDHPAVPRRPAGLPATPRHRRSRRRTHQQGNRPRHRQPGRRPGRPATPQPLHQRALGRGEPSIGPGT
jgi:hypothetical protein